MLKAALANMEAIFSPKVLADGRLLQSTGQVLTVRLSDGLLKARVKDHTNHIYDVFLDLKAWPAAASRCGCITSQYCAHAVACLLELHSQDGSPIQPYIKKSLASSQASPMDLFHQEILLSDDAYWYSELEDKGNNFFAYQLGITVADQTLNVLPLVIELLKHYEISTLAALPDDKPMRLPYAKGKMLEVPLGRLKPLLRVLLQLSKTHDTKGVMVNLPQLLLMQEAENALKASHTRWHATQQIRLQLQQLAELDTLTDVMLSTSFKTELRPYQQQGVNWLQFLRTYHFAGVLADDMGLGKTVQTLAHLQIEKDHHRLSRSCLIIAPTSLVGNWCEEANKFTPDLKVLAYHGQARHQDTFDAYDLVISTYGLVLRDKKKFLSYQFYYIILDEAQFIKNARTHTTQAIQQLNGQHRLCLTGTPIENHLGELWSLFNFLMPGLLGTSREFRQLFKQPIEKDFDQASSALLRGRIKPFMLRRTKAAVLKELPPKTEIIREIELLEPQRDLYEAIRMSMELKVREAIADRGIGKSQIKLLEALLKLRQVCCDPRLLRMSEAQPAHQSSAKLVILMELLDNLMEEGRRVLVFSQFTSMLALIEQELQAREYPYLKLTGATVHRQKMVHDFQNALAPIFLISLKAGGTGLNLTRADTVIHYDPWWNPHAENQATDRMHRIGQENPVFVYKLVTKGTVEEVILRMQTDKKALFNEILHSPAKPRQWQLSQEEIDQFFAVSVSGHVIK